VLYFSENFFELFGLPQDFSVDTDRLSERYHALQQALHPDRFAAASDREKRLSMQASTRVNDAYRTLKDPLARARYLFSLYTGRPVGESRATRDTAFLMEQMELREALFDVKTDPAPDVAVRSIMKRIASQCEQLIAELSERFESRGPLDLEAAEELTIKLQFLYKCQGEAERIESDLDEAP
jgi:molecular chaperone HscB